LHQFDERSAKGDDAGADEMIADIQAMLYELGRESLEENAEWLILHRARPLEPFLGG
jgi:hypothetical protein